MLHSLDFLTLLSRFFVQNSLDSGNISSDSSKFRIVCKLVSTSLKTQIELPLAKINQVRLEILNVPGSEFGCLH